MPHDFTIVQSGDNVCGQPQVFFHKTVLLRVWLRFSDVAIHQFGDGMTKALAEQDRKPG
jgi:hypothetical protein